MVLNTNRFRFFFYLSFNFLFPLIVKTIPNNAININLHFKVTTKQNLLASADCLGKCALFNFDDKYDL